MRALRIPAKRVVLAAALMAGCAIGLSKPAHADNGRSWDRSDERHGARRHHDRHHYDEHQRYSRHHYHEHQRYGRFDGPRFHALPPPIRFQSYDGPAFHGSIVIRSAPERLVLAAPVLPPSRIILPPVPFGVIELGPVR